MWKSPQFIWHRAIHTYTHTGLCVYIRPYPFNLKTENKFFFSFPKQKLRITTLHIEFTFWGPQSTLNSVRIQRALFWLIYYWRHRDPIKGPNLIFHKGQRGLTDFPMVLSEVTGTRRQNESTASLWTYGLYQILIDRTQNIRGNLVGFARQKAIGPG